MLKWLARVLFKHLAQPIARRRAPNQVIGPDDSPYLRRWYLTPWRDAYADVSPLERTRWQRFVARLPNVYLHCILRSDDDRALHDHPWNWASLVLHGRYSELTHEPLKVRGGLAMHGAYLAVVDVELDRLVVVRHYEAGALRGHRAEFAHRLIIPAGGACWTLFFCGWRRREWGFHCPKAGCTGASSRIRPRTARPSARGAIREPPDLRSLRGLQPYRADRVAHRRRGRRFAHGSAVPPHAASVGHGEGHRLVHGLVSTSRPAAATGRRRMRLQPCPTAALRLCANCGRNPDNQPAWARKNPLR